MTGDDQAARAADTLAAELLAPRLGAHARQMALLNLGAAEAAAANRAVDDMFSALTFLTCTVTSADLSPTRLTRLGADSTDTPGSPLTDATVESLQRAVGELRKAAVTVRLAQRSVTTRQAALERIRLAVRQLPDRLPAEMHPDIIERSLILAQVSATMHHLQLTGTAALAEADGLLERAQQLLDAAARAAEPSPGGDAGTARAFPAR